MFDDFEGGRTKALPYGVGAFRLRVSATSFGKADIVSRLCRERDVDPLSRLSATADPKGVRGERGARFAAGPTAQKYLYSRSG